MILPVLETTSGINVWKHVFHYSANYLYNQWCWLIFKQVQVLFVCHFFFNKTYFSCLCIERLCSCKGVSFSSGHPIITVSLGILNMSISAKMVSNNSNSYVYAVIVVGSISNSGVRNNKKIRHGYMSIPCTFIIHYKIVIMQTQNL